MTDTRKQSIQDTLPNQTTKSTRINEVSQSASGAVASLKQGGILRGLLDDLSMAQVIAGALAAATVFLLSSVIGVAGSLIGAALGSVISAVSSQIYKKALSASADKIREAGPTSLIDGLDSSNLPTEQDTKSAASTQESLTEAPTDKSADIDIKSSISAAMWVMNANDLRYTAVNVKGKDPALRRAHERRNRKSQVQRKVLLVSVVSSLIAIVVCSGIITFATQGEGIGTKTQPLLPSLSQQQNSQSDSSVQGIQSENTDDATLDSSDNQNLHSGTSENTDLSNDEISNGQSMGNGGNSTSDQSGSSTDSNSSSNSGDSSNETSGSQNDNQNSSSGSDTGQNTNGSGENDSSTSDSGSTNN